MEPPGVDALYQEPLDAFTAARNALAKSLAQAADREGAAEVKAMRKPSTAAWALNQLARTRQAERPRRPAAQPAEREQSKAREEARREARRLAAVADRAAARAERLAREADEAERNAIELRRLADESREALAAARRAAEVA